jgi:hypothetical protein
MRFTRLLTNLILEQSRFDVLYTKLVNPTNEKEDEQGKINTRGVIDFNTLKKIIFADPTTKAPENFDIDGASVKDMSAVKVGTYTNWLLNRFVKPKISELGLDDTVETNSVQYKKAIQEYKRLFLEDLYKTTDDLKKFERAKSYLPQDQRDINKFTPQTLFDTLRDFKIPEKKKAELEKKEAKKTRKGFEHAGGEVIHQSPNWTVIRISDKGETGKDAAIWYGGFHEYDKGETRWCTSSPGLTYFNTYIKNGPLYVIFPNDDKGQVGDVTGLPKERYQFHFPSSQFMDRDDKQIELVKYLQGHMLDLKDFFKFEFAKAGLVDSDNNVKINIGQRGLADKFLELYGLEELFKRLPDDIEKLIVNNESDKEIKFDVPDGISRFKNLTLLQLTNLVKSIPDSIGQLNNLQFLTLSDNPYLKKIPDSVADLPELLVVSLDGGTPARNNLSTKFLEKFKDDGSGFFFG